MVPRPACDCNEMQRGINYREKTSLMSSPEENNSSEGQISANGNSRCKNLSEFPAVRTWRWLDPVLGNCHDST